VTVPDTAGTAATAPQALARRPARPIGAAYESPWNALLSAAAEPYRRASRFAHGFARGKLALDPVFRAFLEHDLLGGSKDVLDLGCGQGLLAAWLQGAWRCYQSGLWPRGWPPPRARALRGIELMGSEVARARRALGGAFHVTQGDIRHVELGTADAIVALDVLHYLPPPSQIELLQRIRAALGHQGLLLIRVGAADSGLRFRFTQELDRFILLARGHGWFKTYCRPIEEWCSLLRALGFDNDATWMSRGTPFANVLLTCRACTASGS